MTLPALYCVKVGRQEGKETGVMSKYNIMIKKAEEAGRKMATCTLFHRQTSRDRRNLLYRGFSIRD
jgi:hypothetical protein